MTQDNCIQYYIHGFIPIQKNGKIKKHLTFLDKNINALVCFLKKKTYFLEFEYRKLKNEDNKINTIDQFKNKNRDYFNKLVKILPENMFILKTENFIYIYNKDNIEQLSKYLYLNLYFEKNKTKLDTNEKLVINYYIVKLKYKNINNNQLFIELFYAYYIKYIKDEILKKYKKNITVDFNYQELYIFLNKHGYVKHYYTSIVKDIQNQYLKLYKKKSLFEEIPKKYLEITSILMDNKNKIK